MGEEQVSASADVRDAITSGKISSHDAKDSAPSSIEVDEDGPASHILKAGKTESSNEDANQSYLTGWRLQTLLLG
jgi:hypothetical protein